MSRYDKQFFLAAALAVALPLAAFVAEVAKVL
jgi:hypothetical protein